MAVWVLCVGSLGLLAWSAGLALDGEIAYPSSASSYFDSFGNESSSKAFRSVPTTVKTFENDTVLLPCDYKYSYDAVRWLKDDALLVGAARSAEALFERFRLLANGSLAVADVQMDDTGRYRCEIMNRSTSAAQMHAIEVQYAPLISATPSGLLELPVGAVLEMICETEGVPQPAVTWSHNNETVIDYLVGNRLSHVVEIKSRNMSGTIQCMATNGVGQPAVDGIQLHVLFPPEIRVPHKVVYAQLGGRAQLECVVESAPTARVGWLHNGNSVLWGSRYGRQDAELPANGSAQTYFSQMTHSLVVRNVRESDVGVYECRAENKLGTASAEIELTLRPMPCTFKISPDQQSSTSHLLVWQTESFAPVIEFKLKFRQMPSEGLLPHNSVSKAEWTELTIPSDLSAGPIYTTSFTLYGLHPASIYQVLVLARNQFGWSDSSKILRFATGGELEFPNYSTESDASSEVPTEDSSEQTTEHLSITAKGRQLLPDLYLSSFSSSSPSSSSSSSSPSPTSNANTFPLIINCGCILWTVSRLQMIRML